MELPGPFKFHHYLPRNLIEIAGFQSWSDVLIGMANEWPFENAEFQQVAEEIEDIRVGYEDRRARRNA